MTTLVESQVHQGTDSESENESPVLPTPPVLTAEEKKQKDEAREAKRLASIERSIKKYENFNKFEFKASKIRDTIYNLILNSTSEQTKNDLFNLRTIKNADEYEKFKKSRKEFQQKHKDDKEATFPGEVVKPDYEYNFNEMTDSTKNIIRDATNKAKRDRKNKFAKEKIRKWKDDNKELYTRYKELRKELLKKDPATTLEQIVLQIDPKFFDGFVFDFKITRGKGENKVEETYKLPKEMPPALRFKHYLSILTRNNFRCSKDAQNYIAIFIELIIRQVIFTGLININGTQRSKLDVSDLHKVEDAGLAEKFTFLEKFIFFSETYISRPTEKVKAVRTKGKKDAPKKKKEKKPVEEMNLQEKINNKFDYPHFLSKQAGEYCKVSLAKEWKQDERSDIFKVSLAKPFKEFCYSLMTEIVHKIGLILKSEISSRRIKTISTTTVVMAITHLLISMNVSEREIEKTIKSVEAIFIPHVESKKTKKNSKKEEDDDV